MRDSEIPIPFEPAEPAGPASAGAARGRRSRIDPTTGERELDLVHRLEVSALLGEAARLKAAGLTTFGTFAGFPGELPSLAHWRRSAQSALWLLASDGLEIEGGRMLAELLSRPLARWRSALEIARAAHRARQGEESELGLACAELASGQAAAARTRCAALARRSTRFVSEVFGTLARAYLVLGVPCLAQGAVERAADHPGAGYDALVTSLWLALARGDAHGARRAAARLDLLVPGDDRAFRRAIERLRSRASAWASRAGAPSAPERSSESRLPFDLGAVSQETAAILRELARAARSPAERVCCALA
jgi:hypothetical protein